MITLHILQLLEDEGFGTINTDLFWEDIPVNQTGGNKDGVWIISRGAPLARGTRLIEAFDIYSRYADKVTGSLKLHNILYYLKEAYGTVCELPTTNESDLVFTNVAIEPTSNIENAGVDENGKVIRVISGQVSYNQPI